MRTLIALALICSTSAIAGDKLPVNKTPNAPALGLAPITLGPPLRQNWPPPVLTPVTKDMFAWPTLRLGYGVRNNEPRP